MEANQNDPGYILKKEHDAYVTKRDIKDLRAEIRGSKFIKGFGYFGFAVGSIATVLGVYEIGGALSSGQLPSFFGEVCPTILMGSLTLFCGKVVLSAKKEIQQQTKRLNDLEKRLSNE